ncbi:MAG: tRNA dihydrouridine synthase DusB [Planctomycetota bacterium]
MALTSAQNRDVPPARPGEFAELRLGDRIRLRTPVVLAPMAGITNGPFRVLCRRFGEAVYVSEMITARGLVEGNRRTRELCRFLPEEAPRSLQLYGSEPRWLEEAARILVGEGLVDHLDLNLGCPVRKVTAAGGGAAIPYRPRLLARLCGALRRGTDGAIPWTVKMRLGIDDEHLTYLTAGRVAEQEGAAAVGLHARTAAQLYDGRARWEHIGELQRSVSVPVLGNGDVLEAQDALRLMRETGCGGVIVGRGCLGRPWLFRELEAVFAGREPPDPPRFGEVRDLCLEHARLLCAFFGPELGIRQMRKHATWA